MKDEKSTTSSATEGKKRGPTSNAELAKRLDNIEKCLAMMAHMTGQQRVLDKFGIPRWEVTKESMQKGGG